MSTNAALRCRGWQQEAALRMLENNLHPDVAEKPAELVVYGGIGKAARNEESTAHDRARAAAPRGRGDAAGPVRQAGRRLRDACGRAARADRQLEPRARVGDLGALPRARRGRADDVRPDDGGLLDLHREPGHPAGHLRDVRRRGAQALRRDARRAPGRHRGPRRHGRRAAARGHDERRHRAVRRGRPAAHRAPDRRRATWTSARPTSTTRCAAWTPRAPSAGRCRSACSATPPRCCPSSCAAASRSTSSPTRRAPTTRSTATCPPA